MKLRRLASPSFIASIVVVAAACGAPPADVDRAAPEASTAAVASVAPSCLARVNAEGFGSASNRWAWSMKAFGDYLYVGTLNLGADSAALDPDLDVPRASTEPGNTGAQIWRFDGTSWQQVVGDGFGSRFNLGIRNFVVYQNALFALTHNPAEGGQVWRSVDGVAWTQVASKGFGNPANLSVRGAVVWRGKLWLGTANPSGGELWRSDAAGWSSSARQGVRDSSNHTIGELYALGDRLFIGAWNGRGLRIYRYDGSNLVDVVGGAAATPAGFGDPANTELLSLVEFRNALYASTGNPVRGFSVWRSRDLGASWQPMVTGGLGDPSQRFGWRLAVFDDEIYLGTFGTQGSTVATSRGANLYRSKDGLTWIQDVGPRGKLAPAGFGNAANLGIRGLESFFGELHIGTAKCLGCGGAVSGAEVWRKSADGCGA